MFIHILTRILCKNNPNRDIAVKKKPPLTNKHRIKRKHWPKEHLLWYNEKWAKAIYNDENKIELNSNARGDTQKPNSARNKSKYTTKTVKFGGECIK